MDKHGLRSNGGFRHNVRTFPWARDPTYPGAWARHTPDRRTVTFSPIMDNSGAVTNGTWDTTTPWAGATGTFVVADNTFADPVELRLGDYCLVNNFDYVVGGTVQLTSVAIAAAISRLPGFTATGSVAPALAVVTIFCDQQADDTQFYALQHGNVLTFTTFTGNGYLTIGRPRVGPPVLT